MQPYLIAPSILSADFARLGAEVTAVLAAGADMIHFDVMDNHFVPNLTVGPLVCHALRQYGITAPIDVHLMVTPVDRIIADFAKSGADFISFHPEASDNIARTIERIHEHQLKAGLAINPLTSLDYVQKYLPHLDFVLMMSVNPGFAGQSFIPDVIPKIHQVRQWIDRCGRDVRLEVDGGINLNTVGQVAAAGADTFVAGSAIFSQQDYKPVIAAFRQVLAGVTLDYHTP